ncbi:MAG: hypothetical protein ABR579_09930 [Actinomycetota bacterium]
MKRAFVILTSMGLIAGALAIPAQAKKAKPVATTLYMHGPSQAGELDADGVVNPGYLPMDSTKPTGSAPKSKQITNYMAGPNTQCAGNDLFPVWTGHLAGHVVGTLKVTIFSAGTPSTVDVRVWPDVSSQLCTSSVAGANTYIPPAAHQVVTLPAGQGSVTATINNVNFTATEGLMVQITPDGIAANVPDPTGGNHPLLTPSFDRVLYDAAGYETSISFSCIPRSGTSCTG